MMRVLQGDVGSGKTIIALISAFAVIKSGYQVAFYVPLSYLRNNIFNYLKILSSTNYSIELLSGKVKTSEQIRFELFCLRKKSILL